MRTSEQWENLLNEYLSWTNDCRYVDPELFRDIVIYIEKNGCRICNEGWGINLSKMSERIVELEKQLKEKEEK